MHKKAVIVCSGPSLVNFDFSSLNDLNCSVFAVNYIYKLLPKVDYWVSCDTWAAGAAELVEPVQPFFFYPESKHFSNLPSNTHYTKTWPPLSMPHERTFPVGSNEEGGFDSGLLAIALALHMGIRNIAILGFDVTKNASYRKEGWDMDDTGKYHCADLYLERLKGKAEELYNATIINGSLNSRCEAWIRTTPEEAVRWIKQL